MVNFIKNSILIFIGTALVISCRDAKPLLSSQQNAFTAIVTDNSKIFTQNQHDSLTQKIILFEKETTNEIAIFTLDTIDKNIVVFATELANKIGVGKKSKNNGLLILLV